MGNWCKILTTTIGYQADILKGRLEENHIPVVIFNRQDSSYLVFGEIELYVPAHLQELARHLVDDTLMN